MLRFIDQSYSTLFDPMSLCSLPGSSVPGILQTRILEGFFFFFLPCPPPGGLPNPGIEPKSPALQANSLPSEPPEKPFQQLPFNKCCQGNALGECTQGEQEILSLYISCVYAKSLHLCLTLCDPIDYSPPGPSVQGILQARILEWGAMPSSRGSSQPRDRAQVSYSLLHRQAGSLLLTSPGNSPISARCF